MKKEVVEEDEFVDEYVDEEEVKEEVNEEVNEEVKEEVNEEVKEEVNEEAKVSDYEPFPLSYPLDPDLIDQLPRTYRNPLPLDFGFQFPPPVIQRDGDKPYFRPTQENTEPAVPLSECEFIPTTHKYPIYGDTMPNHKFFAPDEDDEYHPHRVFLDPHLRYNQIIAILLRQARHEFDLRYRGENELCQKLLGCEKPLIDHKNHLLWEIYYELQFEYRHDNPGCLEAYEQLFHHVEQKLDKRLKLPPDPLYDPTPYKMPEAKEEEAKVSEAKVSEAKVSEAKVSELVIEDMSPDEEDDNDVVVATQAETNEMLIRMSAMKFLFDLPPTEQLHWLHDDPKLQTQFLQAMSEQHDPYDQFRDFELPNDILERFKALRQ
jgi:hypothetical protein